jgi:hypothetical protein
MICSKLNANTMSFYIMHLSMHMSDGALEPMPPYQGTSVFSIYGWLNPQEKNLADTEL